MIRKAKVGLLPLYLELYDDKFPNLRHEFEHLMETIVDGLASFEVETVRADVCRLAPEFDRAIQSFVDADVDLIITLHLAYSLSLESAEILSRVHRPILLLDTTWDYEFDQQVDPSRIMLNHGIHGVQDLACMLRRMKTPFEIMAGHVHESNVLYRVAGCAKAAYAARCFKNSRLLRIGSTFAGMGDFDVSESILNSAFGLSVTEIRPEALDDSILSVSEKELAEEMRLDDERYEVKAAIEVHRRSVRVGLGLRTYLEQGNFSAFSQNFLAFNSTQPPVDTVPFLEASKAMSRGIGYAGEGDILTAALVGALCKAFPRTTFSEAFCPDWKNGSLFLSHMGEINPLVSKQKPLLCEKDFPWAGALNPAIIACAPEEGPAVWVNLAPGPDDTFRLILAPVDVLNDTTQPALRESVRGWIRPHCRLETFLEEYSRHGGTHHSALVLGDCAEAISAFSTFAGIERIVLHE